MKKCGSGPVNYWIKTLDVNEQSQPRIVSGAWDIPKQGKKIKNEVFPVKQLKLNVFENENL